MTNDFIKELNVTEIDSVSGGCPPCIVLAFGFGVYVGAKYF